MTDSAMEGSAAPVSGEGYTWSDLARKREDATVRAAPEAQDLARILALHGIALDDDAVIQEYSDRLRAMANTVWPADPTQGYDLHSSLGAYAVAKVAVGMVPAGHTSLRHEPLRRAGLIAVLMEHGTDEATALSVLGDWEGVLPGFVGDPAGLSTSFIAGLAERTLSHEERSRALSQVACSPRCLARLASTCNLLSAVRAILPEVPQEDLGPRFSAAVAALALGRPDRIELLFGGQGETLALRTLSELARAQLMLGAGEAPQFDQDGAILMPPLETEGEASGADAGGAGSGDDEDEDDVLEVVEERVQTREAEAGELSVAREPPKVPRWPTREGSTITLDPPVLEEWTKKLLDSAGVVARRGSLLGLGLLRPPPTVLPTPIPPDPRLVQELSQRREGDEHGDATVRRSLDEILETPGMRIEGTVFDPLFPPVRGVLRVIARAAEGVAPSPAAIEAAGDLAWVVSRARALALLVRGELREAMEAVAALPPGASPEGRWASDRMIRFGERTDERVAAEEARSVAAGLVTDLAQQLARTIAGTVPRNVGELGRS